MPLFSSLFYLFPIIFLPSLCSAADPYVFYDFRVSYITASPLGVPQQVLFLPLILSLLCFRFSIFSISNTFLHCFFFFSLVLQFMLLELHDLFLYFCGVHVLYFLLFIFYFLLHFCIPVFGGCYFFLLCTTVSHPNRK